jgi:CheY-like chemotaxis protein
MLNVILEKWIPKTKQVAAESPATVKKIDCPTIKIAGVDVQKGIAKMGGNPELYLRVIKDYYENGRKLTRELQTCAKTGNMKNYHIHAHALNSISENIGADEVSKVAASMESASEQGNLDFVRTNSPGFLSMLTRLLDNIHAAISNIEEPVANKEENVTMEKKKILLIDDTVSYLLILNDILKDKYEPLTSISAEDGIETAKLTNPDLILMDLVMPGMDGYAALEIFKSDDTLKNIPIVIMSGKEQSANEEKGRRMGAAGYIKKPFDASAVLEKIKQTIG